jgi:ubiquinone/menaquinone biosynthesis C-methylase UbiE
MKTEDIKDFWNENPCGVHFVEASNYEDFFKKYDAYRYKTEPHILNELDTINFNKKRILEIGLGQGADSEQIIKRGGIYNGIDLTSESIIRLKKRFEVHSLNYESVQQCNAEHICFEDNSFDVVYSHGVIHHSPHIDKIVSEIYRVLKPEGKLVLMLYQKSSVNYYISIGLIRRLGIFLLYLPFVDKVVSKLTGEPLDRLNKHKLNLKEFGFSYLKMKQFIHRSTDGPDNIYSSVWTRSTSQKLLSDFSNITFKSHLIYKRHFPIINKIIPSKIWTYLESKFGWHLWIRAEK